MDNPPFVSIVVATYNRANILGECLDSLNNQSYPKSRYEVIVINDGSSDGTEIVLMSYVEKMVCGYRYFSQKNMGISYSSNLGIQNAKGEIICFTSDDCIADKDWIKNLVQGYDEEKIAGVGGKIVGFDTSTILGRYIEANGFYDQQRYSGRLLIGANSSYRRDILVKVGKFDPEFRTSGEDTELGCRIILSKGIMRYSPDAVVLHKHRSSLKSLYKQMYGYGKGYGRLHKKYLQNFNSLEQVMFFTYRLLYGIAVYPLMVLKMVFVKDRIYYISKRSLDLLVITAQCLGIIDESLFGSGYKGNVIKEKIDFEHIITPEPVDKTYER